MNILFITLGGLLIIGVMGGLFGMTVDGLGWKNASALWGFSLGLTTIVMAGSLLIAYGIDSHL